MHTDTPTPAQQGIHITALRAQKTAALIALAHKTGITVPPCLYLTSFDRDDDLSFSCDEDVYTEWLTWLGGDTNEWDHNGSRYVQTIATAHMGLGQVRVRFTTSSPIGTES